MNNQIEQLIDGINFNYQQPVSSTKNKTSTNSTLSKNTSLSSGIVSVLNNKTHCQALLDKMNGQAQDYVQSLKKLRSEINTLIRQYDNNLIQINEHPLYLLFQIDRASQLPNLLADKIFIDSLSEKISEDIPAQDLAKSMAIEIESSPILSGQDINEKLAKTALLKSLVSFMNKGDTTIQRSLITAARTGQLSAFISKLAKQEKKLMWALQADGQSLEHDHNLLKLAKTNINQQLRLLRKQLKTIHNLHPHDEPIDMIQKSSKISNSLQQSQQTLHQTLSKIQLGLKGSSNLENTVEHGLLM